MFVVHPIPADAIALARRRLADGDPSVVVVTADSRPGFPCRRCLRDAEQGDEMLLFTHSPFRTDGPYRESGAVLVHAQACAPARLTAGELPEVTTARSHCVVRAYDAKEWIRDGVLVATADASAAIERLLADDDVAMVHVRNVEYGCFAYEVRRAEA